MVHTIDIESGQTPQKPPSKQKDATTMNAQLDQLTQAITYHELQSALKDAIAQGYEIHCKLNAKKEDLIVARNTLVSQINQETFEESVQIKKPLTDAEEDELIASIKEFNAHIDNDVDMDLLTGDTLEALEYQIDLLQDMNFHREAAAIRRKRDKLKANEGMYIATMQVFVEAGAPLDIAAKAAAVIVNDTPGEENLGRSQADQEAVKAAWKYLAGIAA